MLLQKNKQNKSAEGCGNLKMY